MTVNDGSRGILQFFSRHFYSRKYKRCCLILLCSAILMRKFVDFTYIRLIACYREFLRNINRFLPIALKRVLKITDFLSLSTSTITKSFHNNNYSSCDISSFPQKRSRTFGFVAEPIPFAVSIFLPHSLYDIFGAFCRGLFRLHASTCRPYPVKV